MRKNIESKVSIILAIIALLSTFFSCFMFLAKIDKQIALTEQTNSNQESKITSIEERLEKLCGKS